MHSCRFFPHADPIGEYRWRDVSVETSGLAEAIWAYGGPLCNPTQQILSPHMKVCLAVERVWGRTPDELVSSKIRLLGPVTKPRQNANPQGYELIAARLNPERVADALGIAPGDILDRDVDAPDFMGRATLDRLAEAGAPAVVLGAALLTELMKLSAGLQINAADRAAQFIRTRRGNVSIPHLCRTAGISERTLRRRFTSELGVSPKVYARTVRLKSLLMQADQLDRPDWSQLALEHGFSDQSHMCMEVRQMTGRSAAFMHALRRGEKALAKPGQNPP